MSIATPFGWWQVARLGLVQAALGAVVVMTTSTLNRVMVVELALPALLPGLLVALHYAVQVLRPRMGHGADVTGRHTPWITGGVAVLAMGGVGAGLATAWLATDRAAGLALAVLSFAVIGVGVSAAGTALLALLAKRVVPERRAGAATVVWLLMIAGFVVTASVAGKLLDPYSPSRLVAVMAGVSLVAVTVAVVAMAGLEGRGGAVAAPAAAEVRPPFLDAVRAVWADPAARRFTVFVFVSMLAYSAQDLILEPFAGSVFGFTPGASTRLAGIQHGGVLAGMLLAAFAGTRWKGRPLGSLRAWTVGGCIASALALAALAAAGVAAAGASAGAATIAWPLSANVFALGFANGVFSIAAIGSMMRLAGEGRARSEGVRMGVWGAAQALAFGLGGVVGTGASDLARRWLGAPAPAYAWVFALEAFAFVGAALLAGRIAVPHLRATGSPAAAVSAPQPAAA